MLRSQGWRNVTLLAAVSLINDVSGEMLMAVLPFLLVAQGATGLGLGLVGGVTDGIGHLSKLIGGYAGQHREKKKGIIGAGYLVSSVSRFGVALATTWPLTLGFRSFDRVGKGLRTAPRDALLAEQLPRAQRGRAFGLHRTADTAGAVIGVVLALVLLAQTSIGYDGVVLIGAAIGLLSLVPLLWVDERHAVPLQGAVAILPEPESKLFRPFVLVAVAFSLARVSYLFYLVRAAEAVGGIKAAIAWYLWFNVLYAAAAYPAGRLGDRVGRPRLLVAGYLVTSATAAVFALPASPITMLAGFTMLGFSFALAEGQGSALAADLAGSETRSTRLGQYHAFTGVATVIGGLVAGILWDQVSHSAAFLWGAALPLVATLGLLALRPPPIPGYAEPPGHDH
ncbi:MAG: MFS transporter [Candidatus Thermoplasmatota archaeon]